ncbi:MAG: hypothetical protein QOE92_441 [Chloroflexota bacterium]|nr:hypothetical protein [Chloroflexota bacterium]
MSATTAPPAAAARTRRLRLSRPLDLALTLRPLMHGSGQARTVAIGPYEAWRAARNPGGTFTTHLLVRGDEVTIRAWGAGAEAALEQVPELLGEHDDASGFAPTHPLLADLHRRAPGLRIGRSGAVLEALVPVVMEQKVIGLEARAGYSRMLRAVAERAPGPVELFLPPAPERLAAMPYWAIHPFSVERRRAETIIRVARRAAWLEAGVALGVEVARARIQSIPGVGPWSTAEVAMAALGDADAVSVGDYHVPNIVAWALAGKPRGDDDLMLELLEPYRGHRGRVIRLLEAAGIGAPRRGPRLPLRRLERD